MTFNFCKHQSST